MYVVIMPTIKAMCCQHNFEALSVATVVPVGKAVFHILSVYL
jgi:hypothetical protein